MIDAHADVLVGGAVLASLVLGLLAVAVERARTRGTGRATRGRAGAELVDDQNSSCSN